jgi:hypothetical protein
MGLLITLVLLSGCEGGLTLVGHSERSGISGQRGWVETSIARANGSSTRDLELSWSSVGIEATVTLEVDEGSFVIELLDAEGDVTLTLEATPGEPVSGSGYMETDAFGDAEYRVTAKEASGVRYRFDLVVR